MFNYKIYLNYLCFHFSTKEEQRHDWTTAKHSRQRRSEEQHANIYSSGNVKKLFKCVRLCIYIYIYMCVCVCVCVCVCMCNDSIPPSYTASK